MSAAAAPFRTSYAAFASAADPPLSVAGKLSAPLEGAPVPGVLICHGSDGVDGRGAFHAEALNAAGIATFEIDMWAARGVGRGAANRPRSVPETLPDAFAAAAFMARQPEIDAGRIGILGFSWGGVVSLLTATRRWRAALGAGAPPLVGHAALYPVCWSYGSVPGFSLDELTGEAILIQAGDADTYDDPDGLDQLLARLPPASRGLIRGITHQGAGHAFDRQGETKEINDPFAHLGKGGPVTMAFHPEAAAAARAANVAFFRDQFGVTPN